MKSPSKTGTSEYVEKRSRFLGLVVPVGTEQEARAVIEARKKEYHDARHNCWCYILDGTAERYSDDGEPQGTAGIPMMEVMKKEGIVNAVCVVTRYFGGILLGSGGLLRAYTKAARDALADSAPEPVRIFESLEFDCAYPDFDTIRSAIRAYDGEILRAEYGQTIHVCARMPSIEEFQKKYLWKK